MDFKYTLDSSADEPIMLINKHIGMDSEDGEGIMGDQFTRELLFLDTLNKKSIQVWINSGGGVVTDGEQIYHAILKCKTPVDTVCTGTAASIAGPIFVAGRNRSMMDFAKIMMHPVSGGDEKSTAAFEQSIRTMLSSRSFLSEDQVKKLMNRTTWIFPSECETMGLCTTVDVSHGLNINSIDSETASYKEYSKIVNKLIENKKPKTMSKVTNRLGLTEHANEDSINYAIDALENKYKNEIAENKSKFDKYMDEMSTTKKAKDEADTKYNELKAKFEEMEEKAKKEATETNKVKATDLIKNAVSLGKIKNDTETIKEFEEMAVENFEKVEKLINGMTVSKSAPKIITPENKTVSEGAPSIDVNNTSAFVARMNGENLNKAINRYK